MSWFGKNKPDVKTELQQIHFIIFYSYIFGNFFPKSAGSHWLFQSHVTSNNETVSCPDLSAGNIAKSMTSEGNSTLLPMNVDRRPLLQRGLMNFQLQEQIT